MGFVIAKVVAVETGPTGLAMLGQVQSMVASLNGLVNAPAGSGVVRFTAEYKLSGFCACAPWWRASLQWISIICLLVMPTALFFSGSIASYLLKDESLAWVVVIVICVLPFAAVGTLLNSVINGQQNYRRFVGLGMVSSLVSALMMLLMIMLWNIKGALLAAAVQAALVGAVMFISNLRQPWLRLCYWFGTVDKKARRAIGGYVFMAITSALTVPISLIFVRTFLIDNIGWDAAGQWQALWKISEVYLGVITVALSSYYLPRLSSLNGVELIVSEIHRTAIFVLPIVAFLAVMIFLLRDVALSLLFTSEFTNARDLFAVQLCGDVVKIASWLYAYPMLSRGATKWYIFTEILFSLSFVLLSYWFIRSMGLNGVTWSYLLNYVMYFAFVFFNVRRFSC